MKRKILWLASWYPNKLEPLNGDFIERHAKAASLLNEITVIHVKKDHENITYGKTTIVRQQYSDYPSLRLITCYYKSSAGLLSFIKYFRLQEKLIKAYIRENGKPDVINVHISFAAGLAALYAKWKYGLPYIITEHWTIFCPEARPSFQDQSYVTRLLIRKIYRNALYCSAVSHYLTKALVDRFKIPRPIYLPNVVDTSLFCPSLIKHEVFTFVHISVLDYQKSPDEIIDAVELLKQKVDSTFRFIIYGPSRSFIHEKIKKQNVDDVIEYRLEVMQDELATEVKKCHSLVLYSRFETFGCVIIEALASGLPVIVSDIPVMHELVKQNENGIFARIDDAEDLAEKMLWMMENYKSFDLNKISEEAKARYSFRQISEEFDKLYKI